MTDRPGDWSPALVAEGVSEYEDGLESEEQRDSYVPDIIDLRHKVERSKRGGMVMYEVSKKIKIDTDIEREDSSENRGGAVERPESDVEIVSLVDSVDIPVENKQPIDLSVQRSVGQQEDQYNSDSSADHGGSQQ